MTADEARDAIIEAARAAADYWIDHVPADASPEERVSGAIFSFLVALDGGSLGSTFDAVDLMVIECDDDGREIGEIRVSTQLHEYLYGTGPDVPVRWRRGLA
jgi:hypothetical protein